MPEYQTAQVSFEYLNWRLTIFNHNGETYKQLIFITEGNAVNAANKLLKDGEVSKVIRFDDYGNWQSEYTV